jgi:hypothetical protein
MHGSGAFSQVVLAGTHYFVMFQKKIKNRSMQKKILQKKQHYSHQLKIKKQQQ